MNDNTQLALLLETTAAPLGGAHRHHDLLMAAAVRIRELDATLKLLDTEITQLLLLKDQPQ